MPYPVWIRCWHWHWPPADPKPCRPGFPAARMHSAHWPRLWPPPPLICWRPWPAGLCRVRPQWTHPRIGRLLPAPSCPARPAPRWCLAAWYQRPAGWPYPIAGPAAFWWRRLRRPTSPKSAQMCWPGRWRQISRRLPAGLRRPPAAQCQYPPRWIWRRPCWIPCRIAAHVLCPARAPADLYQRQWTHTGWLFRCSSSTAWR